MGDRANVKMDFGNGEAVYLYTHWGGSTLPADVQKAIKKHTERWADPSYLSRIILCAMIPEKEHTEGTGYGISTYVPDNDGYPVIIVRCGDIHPSFPSRGTIPSTVSFQKINHKRNPTGEPLMVWTFDEYIKADTEDLCRIFAEE